MTDTWKLVYDYPDHQAWRLFTETGRLQAELTWRVNLGDTSDRTLWLVDVFPPDVTGNLRLGYYADLGFAQDAAERWWREREHPAGDHLDENLRHMDEVAGIVSTHRDDWSWPDVLEDLRQLKSGHRAIGETLADTLKENESLRQLVTHYQTLERSSQPNGLSRLLAILEAVGMTLSDPTWEAALEELRQLKAERDRLFANRNIGSLYMAGALDALSLTASALADGNHTPEARRQLGAVILQNRLHLNLDECRKLFPDQVKIMENFGVLEPATPPLVSLPDDRTVGDQDVKKRPGLSYHDVYLTTAKLPRTSIFNMPYGYILTCDRMAGWCLYFDTPCDNNLVGAEYSTDDKWLVIDVNGHVVLDSRRGPARAIQDSPRGSALDGDVQPTGDHRGAEPAQRRPAAP